MDRKIVSALVGLAGAVQNNGRTENTDAVVRRALLCVDGGSSDQVVETIHREKFTLSPNCATCTMPCGNTSDYDMENWDAQDPELRLLKEKLVSRLAGLAQEEVLPDVVYKAIQYIGFDLAPESYLALLKELE